MCSAANRLSIRFDSLKFVVCDSRRGADIRCVRSASTSLAHFIADRRCQCKPGFQERRSSMKFYRVFWGFGLFISVAASVSFAQIAAGLRGRVLDPSGAAVANAHVELIESAKNVHQSTTASSTGDYLFTNLNPGSYEIVVAAPGFQNLHHSGITVAVGQTVTADLALSPGGDQQTVMVDSDYPVM